MIEEDMEVLLKVIVVGNGRVGKTSMITRFAKGTMTDNYKKTIGTDFMEKEIQLDEGSVKLMLWDTAGQEMFSKLTRNYYRGSGAVVYVFSTTDRASFEEVDSWRQRVEEECGDIVSVLVQNKIDLLDQAEVSSDEVEDLARRMGVKLYRTCVKDNILVDDVFSYVAESFIKQGGENGMSGVEAVASIGSIGGSKKEETQQVNQQQQSQSSGFSLEPVTRRTGGKKSHKFCSIL